MLLQILILIRNVSKRTFFFRILSKELIIDTGVEDGKIFILTTKFKGLDTVRKIYKLKNTLKI